MSFNRKKHESFAALLDNPVTDYQRENIQSYYKDLIKEHFELIENFKQLEKNYDALYDEVHNPKPLKFEELKVGMWVWDNVYEMYLKIEDIREDIIYPYEDYFCDPCDVSHNMWFDFEENRFYRRQVEQ